MLLTSSSGEAAAEVDPSSPASVEAVVEAEAGTAVRRKQKTEMGLTLRQGKMNKHRKAPPVRVTFKEAKEENLLGVVLIRDHLYTILTKQHIDYVRSKLMKMLEASADRTNIPMPRFKESGVRYGKIHLSCTNDQSHMF